MHSFLISHWSLDPRVLPAWLQSQLPRIDKLEHPDILLLTPQPSLTISHVRQLKSWLARRPYQAATKVAIFDQAHRLTLPAQHALLKSLEEPPAQSLLILSTDYPETLLPTIHSRCTLIQLRPQAHPALRGTPHSFLTSLRRARVGERLNLVADYATKDKALKLCQDLIYHLEPQLKSQPQLAHQLRLIQRTHSLIAANVNPRLALENLVLHL